jgi:hypothetical protein
LFAILGLVPLGARASISIDFMLAIEEVLAQAVFACIVKCNHLGLLSFASLPASEDNAAASCFTEREFMKYLATTEYNVRPYENRTTDSYFARCDGPLPSGQILPRLLVYARLLDTCVESHSHPLEEFTKYIRRNSENRRIGVRDMIADRIGPQDMIVDQFRALDRGMWRNFVAGS